MIRLVCIDVDGTLVGSAGVVHASIWPAMDRARVAGIRVAICSGRPGFGLARQYADRVGADGWHAFQNGASVVRLPSGPSRSSALAPALVRMLITRARAMDRTLELYTDDDYAVERVSDRARQHAALLGVPFTPRPLESLSGDIVRAQWLVSDRDEPAVAAEPHPGLEMTTSTSPVMPDTRFMNITAAGVDKSGAVRLIAGEYGVPLGEVMFVGDGRNDIAAMQMVGHAVAMANAEAEVLRIARTVVGDVDDGGLAQALGLAADGE